MRCVHRVAAVGIVLLILLAGCSSKDEPTQTVVEEEPEGNTISGVVVTPTIQPIPGATVRLVQTGDEQKTDLFGRFRFTGLDAGSYILEARAMGHETTKMPLQVREGEVSRPRIQLSPIAPPVERHQTLSFVGFIKSSFGPADEQVEPYKEQLGMAGCDCTFFFTVPRYTVAMTLEAVWTEDSSPPPEAYDIQFHFDLQTLSLSHRAEVVGGSPLHALLTPDSFAGDGPMDFSKAGSMNIQVRADDVWPTTDQSFQIFLTLWEVAQPPDGWSFVEGDR